MTDPPTEFLKGEVVMNHHKASQWENNDQLIGCPLGVKDYVWNGLTIEIGWSARAVYIVNLNVVNVCLNSWLEDNGPMPNLQPASNDHREKSEVYNSKRERFSGKYYWQIRTSAKPTSARRDGLL